MKEFAEYIKSDEILFKHAKGMRDVTGKEFHIFNEIFLLADNAAQFISDSVKLSFEANTLVIIPKEHFHQFEPIGPEEGYHRYILQFDSISGLDLLIGQVFTDVAVVPNVGADIIHCFEKLSSARKLMSDEDSKALLRALCTQILLEIKYNSRCPEITVSPQEAVVCSIIEYINEHYLENISVKSISAALNYSEAYLSHRFKKRMHTSIYNYILQKKLICAYNYIHSGIPAAQAAVRCGFNEYSGFYKIFKKYFGVAPSAVKNT